VTHCRGRDEHKLCPPHLPVPLMIGVYTEIMKNKKPENGHTKKKKKCGPYNLLENVWNENL
jgi:hypothetical protein